MKSYTISMPPIGMLFKKMHCSICGTKLKRSIMGRTYTKGERGFEEVNIRGYIGTPKQTYIGKYVYVCSKCKSIITYEQQCKIRKIQKKHNKIILSEDEC
ncbi:MAG: hypothetical protein IJW54_03980 [Clostridia bacterium]|nr:hypothetical protein [Clostridia bacterium]